MIRLRRWAPVLATVAVVLLLPAGFFGYGIWKEKYGPPMPISNGTVGVAFSPDERTVAVINPGLEVWDVADRAHPKLLDYSHGDDTVGGANPAFSPDGRVLATGGGAVTLWNVTDPARLTQIAVLPGLSSGVNAVAFSPDGRTLASGLGDGTVVLWDVADPARSTRIATLSGQAGNLTALAFSPNGHLLASASPNGTVFLWNVAAGPGHAHRHPDQAGRRFPPCRSHRTGSCWPAGATAARWSCGTSPTLPRRSSPPPCTSRSPRRDFRDGDRP